MALPFARGAALSDQEQVLYRQHLAFLGCRAGARQQARTYPLGIESIRKTISFAADPGCLLDAGAVSLPELDALVMSTDHQAHAFDLAAEAPVFKE